jgi:hypothetical protein
MVPSVQCTLRGQRKINYLASEGCSKKGGIAVPDPQKLEVQIPVEFEAFICAGVTKSGQVVTQGVGSDPLQAYLILVLFQSFSIGGE